LTELESHTSTKEACELLGLARASVYRVRAPQVHGPRPAPVPGVQPNSLSVREREEILAVINSPLFVDKSPEQVWAIQLDHGVYLGSVSTIYRILRSDGLTRERRAQATHPARVRPELLAYGPNEVWSWDITKLKGPVRGIYYDLYTMLDIFSRKAMNWEVHNTENGDLAKDFLKNAIALNGGIAPRTVHSDNGTSMTSKTVATLLADLHIERSLSRPHVSNDNPYSEALFKTVKYCPAFPDRFTSVYDSRDFSGNFFRYYNTEHRHSGIGLYTPGSVHDGTWEIVCQERQRVLTAAYLAHPERFHKGRPVAPTLPAKVWINRPPTKIES
jgi:putative transposase